VFQHHVHLHLFAVTVVEKLHGLLGPGELARDLTDREVLQQRPDQGGRILGAFLCVSDLPVTMWANRRKDSGRSAEPLEGEADAASAQEDARPLSSASSTLPVSDRSLWNRRSAVIAICPLRPYRAGVGQPPR
jgi:hypothetical protein